MKGFPPCQISGGSPLGKVVTVCLLAGCLLGFVTMQAADAAADAAAEPEDAAGKKEKMVQLLRKAADQHQDRLMESMAVRLEEIDRATQLAEGQLKKLQIAAKGAIDGVVSAWLDNLLRNDDLEAQIGHVDEAMIAQTLASWGMSVTIKQVVDHDVWSAALAEELNEKQQQHWQAQVDENQAFARKVAIDQWILLFNEQLRLSPQQRSEMAALFDEVFDADLAAGPAQAQQVVVFHRGGQRAQPLDKVKDKQVGKILSEVQLKRWRSLRKEIKSGAFAGGGGGWMHQGGGIIQFNGGVININGAVLVE